MANQTRESSPPRVLVPRKRTQTVSRKVRSIFGALFPFMQHVLLTGATKPVNCDFAMATLPNLTIPGPPLEEPLQDLEFPQREAAFFYGLFLRGHSAEELRRDIEVPAAVLAKWDRETWHQPQLRPLLERIVRYRQHVLAIFENLICHDSSKQKLQ